MAIDDLKVFEMLKTIKMIKKERKKIKE